MKAFSLILFLIFSTPFLGYSQSIPYFSSSPPETEKIDASSFFLKKWTAKMGLPISSVSSILVDSKGYIWATTFDGVIRFDGFKIKLFSSSSFPEITNDRFFDILEDRHGNIFFISEIKRAYRVDSETGALSVLSAPDHAKPLYVNQMTKTSFGDILFSTKSGIFESKKGNTLASIIASESGEEMFMAFRDQWGTIWFENSQEQLIRFSDGKMNVINVIKPNALRYFDLEEISGKSWLSWNNTIIEFNEFDYTVHNFDAINQENTIIHLSYNHTNQSILLGTNNSGFFNWNRKSDQVIKSSIKGSSLIAENGIGRNHSQNLVATSLGIYDLRSETLIYESSNELIKGFSQSADSSIWVATNGDGIIHLQKSSFSTQAPEINPNLNPIFEDKSGAIWVGSFGSGAFILKNGTFEPIQLHNGIEDKFITAIGQTSNGTILFGANSSFLYSIDSNKIIYKHLLPIKDNQIVSALFEDSKKNTWVGSTKSLFVKSPNQSSFSTASLISLAEKPVVRYIAESPDSSIWLSTLGAGIIRMRDFKPDYVFKRFGLGTHVTRSITSDPRFSTDPNSYVLWVTTESRGIHRLNVQNDSVSIITITKENGLIDNTIHTIVFDDANNLWMSSNNGLSAVKSEDMDSFLAGSIPYLPTQNFYERDGLPSNEFNGGFQSTGFKSKSGLIYFANQKGLVSFNPATLIRDKQLQKVFIEDVYVNNKPFTINLKNNNALNLPSGIYDIKIFVSIIQPSSSHDQKLYYKVNNQQTEWLEINQGQPLNLSSLDWGTYSISIKSSLNLTDDSAITHFTVYVAPFWYQNIRFFLFLTCVGIGLIYIIIKTRTQFVIKQNQDLEKLITRRSTELQIEQQKNLIASQKMISELTHKNNIIKSIHSLILQPSKLLFESLTVWSTNHKEVLHDSSITSFNELISQSKSVSEKLDRSIKLLSNQQEEVEFSKEEINLNDLLHYVASSLKKKSISLQARSTFSFEDIGVFSVFDGVIVQTALVDLIEFVLRNENASVHAALSKAEQYSTLTLEFANVEQVILDSILSHVSTNEKNYTLDSSADIHYLSLLSSLKRVFENSIGIEGEKTNANTFQITFSFLTSYLGSSNRETNTQEKSFIKSIEEKNQQKFKIAIFDSSKNYSEIIDRNDLPNCELAIMARNGIHGYAQTIAESDMVLLDSNFTYGDPFNLIKTARNGLHGDKLTIVLMTTVFDAKEQHAALRMGADMYITKPLSNDALVAQIESLLSFRKRLLQSIESHTEQLKLPDSGITRSDREFMEKVLSVIKQNISNPDFTVESLSDIMKYNRTSLSKRIKKLVNRNPSSILQELRIVKAVELLQTNDYNISEVAYTCGFSSLSYFSQAFKSHMNISPTDWQAQQLSTNKTQTS